MKPHKHAAVIHAYADGQAVQVYSDGKWEDCGNPSFLEPIAYRIKPAAPVIETKMSKKALKAAFHSGGGWKGIATAAINRAVADGQVVPISSALAMCAPKFDRSRVVCCESGYEFEAEGAPKDMDILINMIGEFSRMKEARAKRDMAVAEAVSNVIKHGAIVRYAMGGAGPFVYFEHESLAIIIAKVTP